MPHTRRSEQGFTLVEVLVALVVAGLLTVIVVDRAGEARRRASRADQLLAATLLAEAAIRREAVAPFQTNPIVGKSGELSWRVWQTMEQTDRRGTFALVRINVSVEQDRKAVFRASTLRIKSLVDG